MAWQEFEDFVAELFRHLHRDAHVKLTSRSRDFGVDVIVRKKNTGEIIVVQCKRWNPKKKRVQSVDAQVFGGGMFKHEASRGFFVTTSDFNAHARKFAEGTSMHLVNGKALVKMVKDCKGFPSVSRWQAMRERQS